MWYEIKDAFVQAGEVAANEVRRIQRKQAWIAEVNAKGLVCQNKMHPHIKAVYYKLYIWTWSDTFQEYQKLCPERLAEKWGIIIPVQEH